MIKMQDDSQILLMSLANIQKTRDIVLQTEKTESKFAGSGEVVYVCEVVSPSSCRKPKETATDKLAAEIERVNDDNRALRRRIDRLERALQKERAKHE